MGYFMRKTKPKWKDNAIQEAIRALKQSLSIRRAAGAISVLMSCLLRKIQGSKMNKCLNKRGGETVFSCEREKQLVDRIVILSKCGFSTISTDVRRAVYSFATAKKKTKVSKWKLFEVSSEEDTKIINEEKYSVCLVKYSDEESKLLGDWI
jgi:hypothetical protein